MQTLELIHGRLSYRSRDTLEHFFLYTLILLLEQEADLYFYTVAQHKLFCANQLVLDAVLAKIFWYHATVCPLDQQNLVCDFICHLTTLLSMCKVLFIQGVEQGASHPAQTNIPHQLFCICCKTLMYTPELGTLQRSLQAAVAVVCEQMDAWMGPKLN